MGTTEPFESFRRVVLADPELQARLRVIPDWPTFVGAAIDAASERGITLTEETVAGARDEARRTWRQQWI